MKRFRGKYLFPAALLVLLPSAVCAQPAHVQQLRDAAVACLGTTLGDIKSFTLEADERAPYLRSQLVAHWINEGREVFETDSAMPWHGHVGERVVWVTRPLPPELSVPK